MSGARRRGRFPDDQGIIDFVMHDGLLAREMTDQVLAGALPGGPGRDLDGGQARPQVPAPVEIVESNHRQIARDYIAAALGLQQHAVGDHVVAADQRARPLRQAQEISGGLAGIVERIGHLDMPLRRQLDAMFGQRAAKAVDPRAGAIIVPLQRRHDSDPAVAEFDQVQRRAIGRRLIVGADARVGAVRPVDPDIDEGNGVCESDPKIAPFIAW